MRNFYRAVSVAAAQQERDVQEAVSTSLDLDRPQVRELERAEPADALKPLTDYRAEYPSEPAWAGRVSGAGILRDTIWQITSLAAHIGLLPRPWDPLDDLVIPLTGDWAGLRVR